MDKIEIKDKIDYVAACVSEFAKKFFLSHPQAYGYLRRFNGINLLVSHYNIMHTLSIEEVVNDLQIYCSNHGGKIE